MPADMIFVLVLVAGIAVLLGWLSWHSHRNERVAREQKDSAALVAAQPPETIVEPPRHGSSRARRKRK